MLSNCEKLNTKQEIAVVHCMIFQNEIETNRLFGFGVLVGQLGASTEKFGQPENGTRHVIFLLFAL